MTDEQKIAFRMNTLVAEVREYMDDFDTDVLPVEDCEIKTSQNVPITHVTRHSSRGGQYVGLWCGNPDPDKDKHAEELIVSDTELSDICQQVINLI